VRGFWSRHERLGEFTELATKSDPKGKSRNWRNPTVGAAIANCKAGGHERQDLGTIGCAEGGRIVVAADNEVIDQAEYDEEKKTFAYLFEESKRTAAEKLHESRRQPFHVGVHLQRSRRFPN
jgi:hypothetical protein